MTNMLTKEKVIKMKNIANELKGDAKYCGENIFAGTLNQKHYLLKYDNQSLVFNIYYNVVLTEEETATLTKKVKKLNKNIIIKYKNSNLNIVGSCNSKKELSALANPIIEEISTYLSETKKEEVCKHCKQPKKLYLVNNDGEICYLCNDCYNEYLKEAKFKVESSKKSKQNTILGIIGALIGTIPGILSWFFLGFLNIENGLAAIIIAIGASLGFKWLGKNMKTSGMIISIAIALLTIFVAHELNCTYYIYKLYKQDYMISLWDAYKSIPYYLNTISDFKKMFINQLISGYILSIAGIFSAYSLHRQSIYTCDIKKIGGKNE